MKKNMSSLAEVFSHFELTSRTVADMLNVHYSLVSKWLNNKRPLKCNSEHMKKLVDLLISLDSPRNYERLKTLLLDAYQDIDLADKEKLAVYLGNYLATDRPEHLDKALLENVNTGQVYDMAKVDIYKKNTGRRDALIRLLETAVALSPGCELMLYSGENLSWHMEQTDFLEKWYEKYKEIIHLGNRVTMVHTIYRNEPQLLHSIAQWLPLHLTGKTTAYFHPEYSKSIYKSSISLIKNHAALAGMTVEGFSDTFNTYYFTNQDIVKQFEVLFYGLLSNSRPLFEDFGYNNLMQNMLAIAQKYDNSYIYSNFPFELAMDLNSCRKILHDNGIDGNKYKKCMEYYSKIHEHTVESLSRCKINLILNEGLLQKCLSEGFPSNAFNWIIGGNLMITPGYFKQGLIQIIDLLRKNNNLSLGLVDDYIFPNMRNTSMLIKENTAAVASSNVVETAGPLITKEPIIVRTFYQYFEHYWDSISRTRREKEHVVRSLLRLFG
jgi:hypothetical protein